MIFHYFRNDEDHYIITISINEQGPEILLDENPMFLCFFSNSYRTLMGLLEFLQNF